MFFFLLAVGGFAIGAVSPGLTHAQTLLAKPEKMPPPPVEIVVRTLPQISSTIPRKAAQKMRYSSGEPTPLEQLYLELINRARADPPAEGARLRNSTNPAILSTYNFFNVDLALMESEFAVLLPAPPLVMNAQLLAAARRHSQDMLANDYQGHIGHDDSEPWDRTSAEGYRHRRVGENVFAYAKSVVYGHAGFQVDWGFGLGGMQKNRGHRANIHSAAFREVGIGIVEGRNDNVGPQVVTQDFATSLDDSPFVTGVSYFDLNADQHYNSCEGIGGLTVSVAGINWYAVTSATGGYAIPVTGNGTYSVQFTSDQGIEYQTEVLITDGESTKLDFNGDYAPPILQGDDTLAVGESTQLAFSAVLGAQTYELLSAKLIDTPWREGAEDEPQIIDGTNTSYAIRTTSLSASGSYAFHLTFPSLEESRQSFVIDRLVLPNQESVLRFKTRRRWSTETSHLFVQVSVDNGSTWQTIWSRAGIAGTSSTDWDQQWLAVSIPLGDFADKPSIVRFVYDGQGSQYTGTSSDLGVFIDDIDILNSSELTDATVTGITSGQRFVQFSAPVEGKYYLAVRAKFACAMPYGPGSVIHAGAAENTILFDNFE